MNHAAVRYFHLSNLVSYLSLFGGVLAIFYTREAGNLAAAGGLIAFCSLADLYDGKFANLFTRSDEQKAFGVQLDSLTDAVVFGATPVICLLPILSSASGVLRLVWFAAAFFHLVCAITRLGAYNIQEHTSKGFVGLPTTVSGLLWSSFFLMNLSTIPSIFLLLGCGSAMVSPVGIRRPGKIGMLLLTSWAVVLMLFHGFFFGFRIQPSVFF